MRRVRPTALLYGLLLGMASQAMAAAPAPVRSLEYGEALFYFFQQDYLNAGVRLMAAQQRRRLGTHDQDADLLLGGLQLAYGMHDVAARTFDRVLDAAATPAARDRAWYALARLAYRRGDWQRANQALGRISVSDPQQAAKTALLSGLVALAQQQPGRGVAVLQQGYGLQAGVRDPYLEYNLAIALIRTGKSQEAVALLDGLGQRQVEYEEAATIRDHANLAAAFALLQSGAPQEAQRFFGRVRLTGTVSNLALLGSGWAAVEAGSYAQALTPWRELMRRTPRDAPVLEALIAVPFVHLQLDENARAARVYEQAVEIYQEERNALTEAIAETDDPEWLLQVGLLTRSSLSGGGAGFEHHWLPRLIASNTFQEAWKNYRDLLQLEQSLSRWQQSLNAYQTMLTERKARFDLVVPQIEKRLAGLDPNELHERRKALQTALLDVIETRAVWRLATAAEKGIQREIEALAARVEKLSPSSEKAAFADRVRRLQGLHYWQVHAAFPQRRWQATRAVDELDAPLAQMGKRIGTLRGARAFARLRIGDLEERIHRAQTRIVQYRPRLAQTLVRQRERVKQLAQRELTAQQAQIDSYLLQARYALAQLYDRAQDRGGAQ